MSGTSQQKITKILCKLFWGKIQIICNQSKTQGRAQQYNERYHCIRKKNFLKNKKWKLEENNLILIISI